MYYKAEERFFGRKELNIHKLKYRYFWIDLQQAAKNGTGIKTLSLKMSEI